MSAAMWRLLLAAAAGGLALLAQGAAAQPAAGAVYRWGFCGALDANYSHFYRSSGFYTAADDATVKAAWLRHLAARHQLTAPGRTFCTFGTVQRVDAKWIEAATTLSAAGSEVIESSWDGGPGGASARFGAASGRAGPPMNVQWRPFSGTTAECVARATATLTAAGYSGVAKTNETWKSSYAFSQGNTVVIHFHCEIPGWYYYIVAGDQADLAADAAKVMAGFERQK